MKVVFLAEAETEIDDAAAWYDDRRDGLGDELLADLQGGFDIILEAPDAVTRCHPPA